MPDFEFDGRFLRAVFNTPDSPRSELEFHFGDLLIECDSYYWFDHQDQLTPLVFSRRVRRLTGAGEPNASFGLMFQKMVDLWTDVLDAPIGNMIVGFFDEMCHLIRLTSQNDSDVRLSFRWTPDVKGYQDHPLNIQRKYGERRSITTKPTDQGDEIVQKTVLKDDFRRFSKELEAWVDEQIDGQS